MEGEPGARPSSSSELGVARAPSGTSATVGGAASFAFREEGPGWELDAALPISSALREAGS